MNKQSVKRRREDDDDDGSAAIAMNRLSQLPQPILHPILSLLPQKDAVRTCVLSKSWRYIWHGRLNVELCDNCFTRKEEFWSFLDKTLQRYLDQNLSLQKFLVDIRSVVDYTLLQKWIPVLIMNMGVKSLNLIFSCTSIYFPLPLVVFQSESLVELHLQWLNLNTLKSTDDVMLRNLQTLRLHSVYITDEIFDKLISGCPLIENLDLSWCTSLKSIKLQEHCNIKKFRCMTLDEIIIEIENPQSLESVHIQKCRDWFFRHRNTHFPFLKSLNLHSVQLPAQAFNINFSSFFPCLNELILESCHGLKEIRLLSSSIKRLTIRMGSINPGEGLKAFIDTPNIHYFEYFGHGFLPFIKFATTSNEWASDISVWYKLKRSDNDSTSWFFKLNNLLEALSQSHITLNLIPNKYKKLHINDNYGCFYKPVVVKHLRLLGYFPSSFIRAILNCYFRVCRPRYISMDQNANELAEFICYSSLQDLDEVSIEVWDYKAEKWNYFQGTTLPEPPIPQRFRFRLTWREQLSMLT